MLCPCPVSQAAVGCNFSKIVDCGGGDGLGFGTDAIAGSNGGDGGFVAIPECNPGRLGNFNSPCKPASLPLEVKSLGLGFALRE